MGKKPKSIKKYKKQFIGQLVASIPALLVALIVFILTTRQQTQKDTLAYEGQLYALHTELYWHHHQLNLLKTSLQLLAETTSDKKDFLISKPIFEVDINLSNQILLQLVEFEDYQQELIVLLTSYNNQIKSLNYFLDFENAVELLNELEESDNGIAAYVSVLDQEYISKSQSTITEIQLILKDELKHLPKSNTLFNIYFEEITH
ncbi:MAG: hypothetical protein CMP48_04735 [Rickettsiales bacterium]|nr:hypothetical protein [Rickettsiales bacterium]